MKNTTSTKQLRDEEETAFNVEVRLLVLKNELCYKSTSKSSQNLVLFFTCQRKEQMTLFLGISLKAEPTAATEQKGIENPIIVLSVSEKGAHFLPTGQNAR